MLGRRGGDQCEGKGYGLCIVAGGCGHHGERERLRLGKDADLLPLSGGRELWRRGRNCSRWELILAYFLCDIE